MVATRRGVRVSSPAQKSPEQCPDVQATPSTARKSRRATKQVESPTQNELVEICSKLKKSEGGSPDSASTPMKKRCSKASRLQSPEQPSTPVGSVHEVDMSEMESCCSAVSDTEAPVTRARGRRQLRKVHKEEEEISEVESCSSAVSASKHGQRGHRSTRKKTESSDAVHVEVGGAKVDQVMETESCSSVVSDSQRVTRSQRKTARTRSSAKRQTEDSEFSDADSCISSVSGAEVPKSTTRRATRSRRQTDPIPMHLDELPGSSQSRAPTRRQTRGARTKTTAPAHASEPPSCDSEGFESGPTYSLSTRRRGRTQSTGLKAMDSDSDMTEVHSQVGSPSSTQGRATPCSSRTGSGNSSRSARASRRSAMDCSVVVENAGESAEEDNLLNDSKLESTVIAEDADKTLLDEDKSQTLEEEGVNNADLSSHTAGTEKVEMETEDSHASPSQSVSEPAVVSKNQQEELSAENTDGDTLQMEMKQETVPSSDRLKLCPSVATTTHEKALEITEEDKEKQEDVGTFHSLADEPLDDEDVSVESRSSVEEEMEVSTLKTDAQQVVESVQVTSNQQHKVTVGSDSEQRPKDVVVQNRKMISLLDSSDDEEDDEEEREVSEEEDSGYRGKEDRGEPSNKSEAEAASVAGLFMIDKRPGEDADEQYYKEERWGEEAGKGGEQEEQDEEFVDEEGDDDDDDDEDAKVLFSSRNSHLKELSSCIDPGIRVKELGGLYISFDGSKSKPVSSSLQKLKEKKIQDEVMKKSVIGPDFEKKDAVPPYSESKQALKLKRRAEREKSTGDGWFNMKAPEITPELKGDLQVLKMRGSLDSKRFYKKNDRVGFPKYFEVGTVVDNAADFYHSRIPKKDRKRTIVEELLTDAEFRQKNKQRYQRILAEKAAQVAGKRNKKKNKFHKK